MRVNSTLTDLWRSIPTPNEYPPGRVFSFVARMTLLMRILALIAVIAAIACGQADGSGNSGSGGAVKGDGPKTVPLKTHSLFAPYLDSDLQSRWYIAP